MTNDGKNDLTKSKLRRFNTVKEVSSAKKSVTFLLDNEVLSAKTGKPPVKKPVREEKKVVKSPKIRMKSDSDVKRVLQQNFLSEPPIENKAEEECDTSRELVAITKSLSNHFD